MPKAISRKRPCRICRKWFLPNVRLKDRQMTCADPECQKKWHKKQCALWNKKNQQYFKANYLQKKIKKIDGGSPECQRKLDLPKSRIKLGLPRDEIQEMIKPQHFIIIEYILEQIVRRYQLAIQLQLAVKASKKVKYPS